MPPPRCADPGRFRAVLGPAHHKVRPPPAPCSAPERNRALVIGANRAIKRPSIRAGARSEALAEKYSTSAPAMGRRGGGGEGCLAHTGFDGVRFDELLHVLDVCRYDRVDHALVQRRVPLCPLRVATLHGARCSAVVSTYHAASFCGAHMLPQWLSWMLTCYRMQAQSRKRRLPCAQDTHACFAWSWQCQFWEIPILLGSRAIP